MKNALITLSVAAAVAGLGMSASWAESTGHMMVTPDELKWTDVASVPPGAKITVIEGPLKRQQPRTTRAPRLVARHSASSRWNPNRA